MQVNAARLADALGVSRARISQYVSSGVLTGCFTGEGRQRLFDVDLATAALKGGLDRGQMLGNGASTKKALREIDETGPKATPLRSPKTVAAAPRGDGALSPADPDRYELARTQSAEEDARRKRRDNERDEGRWVIAAEAEQATARLVSQEIGKFETVLRDGARAVADKLGVDYRETRQILMQVWREYRSRRATELMTDAQSTSLTEAEREAES